MATPVDKHFSFFAEKLRELLKYYDIETIEDSFNLSIGPAESKDDFVEYPMQITFKAIKPRKI